MEVESQNVGPCRMKLTVSADAEETRPDYEEVVGLFMKKGRVPGFRPGHTPREVILRTFGKGIKEEVENRLIRKFHKAALKDRKVRISALLSVTDVLFTPETGISFSLLVDVKPEFVLPKYRKIPLTFNVPVVTEEQVDAQIGHLRNAFAKFEDAEAGHSIVVDDMVAIDFTGTVDGRPIEEVAPDAKAISSGKDFWLQVADGKFLPEVVKALKGLRAGERTEAKFTFGPTYPVETLRGKEAVYALTVKKVRKCELPEETELLKQINAQSMEALRAKTRRQLQANAEEAEKIRREQMIKEALLNKTGEFDLPETEVSGEINTTLSQMMSEAQYRGLTHEDLKKNRTVIIEDATRISKRRLRLRYLFEAIAEAENIQVSEDELDEKIRQVGANYGKTPEQFRALLEKNNRLGTLKESVLADKCLAFLMAEAKVK